MFIVNHKVIKMKLTDTTMMLIVLTLNKLKQLLKNLYC